MSGGPQFAIRPTMRNHNLLKRDAIIQKVASIVGHRHRVDLKNYDDLIVVEAYTVCICLLCLERPLLSPLTLDPPISLPLPSLPNSHCSRKKEREKEREKRAKERERKKKMLILTGDRASSE